jgi:carbamate kinase
MRILVAVGGNALLERGEKPDAGIQRRHVQRAAEVLAPLANAHELVVCHGNGPQIGVLALESTADTSLSEPYPLDVLGAQTQGMIGYWLAQELRNAGLDGPVATIVTQTVVDASDPAFAAPKKFIGPVYERGRAERLAREHGWTVGRDGKWWRRVVPSPEPSRIVEHTALAQLMAMPAVVICGGGGGVPVTENDAGQLTGVEAVVDKDLAAAAIAECIAADRLLLLTDVPAVMRDFGTPHACALHLLDTDQLATMHFPDGSMGPKVEACRRFVTTTGNSAAIGALRDAGAILAGTAGTRIVASTAPAGSSLQQRQEAHRDCASASRT